MRAAERMEARGLAMPCPAMSGAEPWTLENMLDDGAGEEKGYIRFTHHERVASVDGGDQSEGTY